MGDHLDTRASLSSLNEEPDASPSKQTSATQPDLVAQAGNDPTQPETGEPVPVDAGDPAQVDQAAIQVGAVPADYAADANNIVRLPAGVSVENIRVNGSDIILEQTDGTLITIKNAALNVPTFLIGEVEVPRIALLAALEASGIDVAFGLDGSISVGPDAASSSGGNFGVPAGPIGDPFDLSDLLPPTALSFDSLAETRLVGENLEVGDDVPVSLNDPASVDEDSVAPIAGNVLANDQPGADGPASFVGWAGTAASYGTLTVDQAGGYSYLLQTADPAVQRLDTGETLTETFTYTMRDADGDTDTATLTITITGSNDTPVVTVNSGNPSGANDQVFEADLPAGSDAAANREFATGTFRLSDPDGLDDVAGVTINGVTVALGDLAGHVFTGAHGTMTVTAYNSLTGVASYSYQLTSPTADGAGAETDVFTLRVSDGTVSSPPVSITIDIVDDVPLARDDADSVGEDAALVATGNVVTAVDGGNDANATDGLADTLGADGFGSIAWAGAAGSTVAGLYGTLTVDASGGYSYQLDNSRADVQGLSAGETLKEKFSYSLSDGDGDGAPATLTITITGSNDAPTVDASTASAFSEAIDASAQDLSQTGTVDFGDIDTNDVVDITFAANGAPVWSGGSIDAGLAAALVAGFSTGVADAAAPGSTPWSYAVNDANLDFLSAGETITFSYTVTATDSQGATATDTVSFTITGSNDAPTVDASTASAFSEAIDASAQDLSQTGTVDFGDIDTNDVVDITFAANGAPVWSGGSIDAGLAAALVAGFSTGVADAAAPGSTPWSYAVNDANLDFLSAGETITFSYTVTATDSQGATATDTVSFTITGSNDAPTVDASTASAFSEAIDASAQDLSQTGTVDFGDIDTNDVVDITFAANGAPVWSGGSIDAGLAAALVAGFSTGVADAAAPGSTPWSYAVNDANLDFLSAGETITFSYTVTATDSQGATATDTVSFTITGSNDAPTVDASTASAFSEAIDASAQDLSQTGTVDFGDIDTNDVVDITFAANGAPVWSGGSIDAGLAAALVAGFSTGVADAAAPGSTPWSYAVNDANLDFLSAGETITFSYTVTATDSQGATATDTVSFTITGSNDAPTVDASTASAFSEAIDASAQDLSQTGTVDFGDIDTNDVVDITFAANGAPVWSGGSLDAGLAAALVAGFSTGVADAAAPGSTPWSYAVNDANLDFLSAGETITFSYTVTATDSQGATATDTVSFTITGSNDAPTVDASTASAFSEAIDASAQDLSQTGTVDFGDIDTNDVVDITFAANGAPVWSGGSIDAGLAAALVAGFSTGVADAAAPGSTPWSYAVNDANLDFLSAGETITFSYTVTATDSQGATATDTVSFTITGSNDAPTVDASTASAFSEAIDASAQDLSQTGTVDFGDIDTNDVVDITFAANGAPVWSGGSLDAGLAAALVAGFSTGVADAAAPGSTPWSYAVNDANLDFLSAGETITFSYTVTATDSQGATATDTVSFTITGSNDAPTVDASTASAFSEAIDASAQDLSQTGTVDFGDIDTNDVVDITFAANGAPVWSGGSLDAGLAAALVAGFSTGVADAAAPGSTPWSYAVNDANLDFLSAGETITFSYTVTATDSQGATATDTVSFTITGSNDAPTVTVDQGNGGANDQVFEAGLPAGSDAAANSETATGTFRLSDADGLDDVASVTINGVTVAIGSLAGHVFNGAHGTLTVTAYDAATGVASYSYELTSPTTDGAGIEHDIFTLSVSDGTVSSPTATITIDIVDDVPNAVNVVDADILDDEGLTAGIVGGTGDAAGTLTSTGGSLGYAAGADGVQSLVMTGPSTLGTESVTSIWNGATQVLTISSARGTLMTINVTDLATGTYVATLVKPLLHAAGGNENDITVNLSYQLTDGDGDTASGSLQLTVDDDAPIGLAPEEAVLVNTPGSNATYDLDYDANIDNNVGADQVGRIAFANITNGQTATGIVNGSTAILSASGQLVQLFLVDNDNNALTPDRLEAWTGGLNTGTKIFQVTLQPDGGLGTSDDHYRVDVFSAIGATQITTVDNFSALGSNSQQFKALDAPGTTQDLLFSGYKRSANGSDNAASGEAVSASSTGIGVANNSMNDGESLRIDFVNDLTVSGSNNNTYDYSTHYNANNFQFKIVQVGGSPPPDSIETWVRIYGADNDDPNTNLAADAAALANDDQLETITGISVNGVSLILSSLITDGNGGYLVTGLDLNDTICVTASGTGYNRIEIENARSINGTRPYLDGENFDIGDFAFVTTTTNIPSVKLDLDLSLTDMDGDSSLSSLSIDLLAAGSATTDNSGLGVGVNQTAGAGVLNIIGTDFNDNLTGNTSANVLAGREGFDTLNGGAGNDTLIGGHGNDNLSGGTGADLLLGGLDNDTFVIAGSESSGTTGGSGDSGTLAGFDVIGDFNVAQDKLDLGTVVAATSGNVDGSDSGLTIGGNTVESHSVTNGMATFYGTDSFTTALTLTSIANVAAAVQYLQGTDIGAAGATIAFTATIDGTDHTFIYRQGGDNSGNGTLVELQGVTLTNLNTLIGGAVDPIVIDLDHNGYKFSSLGDGVQFDINADGNPDQIAWNTSNDGILAYDLDGSGKIEDGSELFTPDFGGGSFATGSAALASLDSNGDDMIDSDDQAFANLVIWKDADADGVSDEGELSSFGENGIEGISATTHVVDYSIDGQSIIGEGTFHHTDGSTGSYVEVALDTSLGAIAPDASDGDDAANTGGTVGIDPAALSDPGATDVVAGDNDDQGDVIDLTALVDVAPSGDIGGAALDGNADAGASDTSGIGDASNGGDAVVIDADAFAGIGVADLIADYHGDQGEAIDLAALLDTAPGGGDVGSAQSVDAAGAASAASFPDVAAPSVPLVTTTISLLYDDNDGSAHAAKANGV